MEPSSSKAAQAACSASEHGGPDSGLVAQCGYLEGLYRAMAPPMGFPGSAQYAAHVRAGIGIVLDGMPLDRFTAGVLIEVFLMELADAASPADSPSPPRLEPSAWSREFSARPLVRSLMDFLEDRIEDPCSSSEDALSLLGDFDGPSSGGACVDGACACEDDRQEGYCDGPFGGWFDENHRDEASDDADGDDDDGWDDEGGEDDDDWGDDDEDDDVWDDDDEEAEAASWFVPEEFFCF